MYKTQNNVIFSEFCIFISIIILIVTQTFNKKNNPVFNKSWVISKDKYSNNHFTSYIKYNIDNRISVFYNTKYADTNITVDYNPNKEVRRCYSVVSNYIQQTQQNNNISWSIASNENKHVVFLENTNNKQTTFCVFRWTNILILKCLFGNIFSYWYMCLSAYELKTSTLCYSRSESTFTFKSTNQHLPTCIREDTFYISIKERVIYINNMFFFDYYEITGEDKKHFKHTICILFGIKLGTQLYTDLLYSDNTMYQVQVNMDLRNTEPLIKTSNAKEGALTATYLETWTDVINNHICCYIYVYKDNHNYKYYLCGVHTLEHMDIVQIKWSSNIMKFFFNFLGTLDNIRINNRINNLLDNNQIWLIDSLVHVSSHYYAWKRIKTGTIDNIHLYIDSLQICSSSVPFILKNNTLFFETSVLFKIDSNNMCDTVLSWRYILPFLFGNELGLVLQDAVIEHINSEVDIVFVVKKNTNEYRTLTSLLGKDKGVLLNTNENNI